MMRALPVVLALLAGTALAQQKPPAQTPPPEPPAQERRPLNLQLDKPSSFATIAPPEKKAAEPLPALGGDARKVQEGVRPDGSSSVFPKDSNPGR